MFSLSFFVNLFYISTCFSLGLYVLAVKILNQKIEKSCCLLFCGIFYGIQIFTNYLLYLSLDSIGAAYMILWNVCLYSLHGAILSFLLVRTYRTKVVETISSVAIGHFISFTIGNLAEEVMVTYFSAEERTFQYIFLYNLIPHTVILVSSVMIALLLKRLEFQRYFKFLFTGKVRSVVTMLCSLFLMHMHTIARIAFPVSAVSIRTASYSVIFIFLSLFCLQFAAMYTAGKEKIKAQEEIIRQQQSHLALLEELQQEMRMFRHDFTNLISGITIQAKEGDLTGIRQFMSNTGHYFDTRLGDEIKQLESVSKIEIYPLRSLFTSKLGAMQEKKIKINLEIMYPVVQVGMRVEDLIRCIGILLDNAIEEAERSSDRYIQIMMLQQVQELHVVISNTYKDKPSLDQMKQTGYSTKGKGRGTGLKSFQKLTKEYPGCITGTYIDEGLVTQELRIPTAS